MSGHSQPLLLVPSIERRAALQRMLGNPTYDAGKFGADISVVELKDWDRMEDMSQYSSAQRSTQRIERLGRDYCSWASRFWILEALSEIVAILGILGLYAILHYYDGLPQASWQVSHFTLNGVIALLATITKGALMLPVSAAISQRKWLWFAQRLSSSSSHQLEDFETFDKASRGALGSVKLLQITKVRHLASLGAGITLLSLAFSTLTQNSLTTTIRAIPNMYQGAPAGDVQRSERYDVRTGGDNSYLLNNTMYADIPTMAAIYNGLYSKEVSVLQATCPTGNCTWPTVPTIGMCGGCSDMTASIEQSCNATWCNYSVPSSLLQLLTWNDGNKGIDIDARPEAWAGSEYPIFAAGQGQPSEDQWPNYTLGVYDFLGVPGDTYAKSRGVDGLLTYPHRDDIVATRCSLWACMQAHDVKTSFGQQSSVPIRTSATGRQSDRKTFDYTFNFTDIPEDFNVDPNTVYGFSTLALNGIIGDLDTLMSGLVTDDRHGALQFMSDITSDTSTAFDPIRVLWASAHDLNPLFEKMALSLSNLMRVNGVSTPTARYAGITVTEVVYFKAQWIWLAFPAGLVALSTLFLGLSIAQACHSNVPAWKDSALATLFVSVEPCIQEVCSTQTHLQPKDAAKIIRQRKIQLVDGKQSWVFGQAGGA